MERLEVAVKVLRLVNQFNYKFYSREEVKEGLTLLGVAYNEVQDGEGYHLTFEFDPDLAMHFTYENNRYYVTKYNIFHGLFNELQKYYNELNVEALIDASELAICQQDIALLETVAFKTWEDRELIVRRILKMFNQDELVATLMFLKYIGGSSNRSISYIERHADPITYRGIETNMCIEVFNANYYRMVTIDIVNCHIVDDPYELIVNAFKLWHK